LVSFVVSSLKLPSLVSVLSTFQASAFVPLLALSGVCVCVRVCVRAHFSLPLLAL